MYRIHVLTADNERLLNNSLINALAPVWRERGDIVSVGHRLPGSCDCLIAHTDRTVVDNSFFPTVDPGVRIINGRARDIRKSVVSTALLRPDSDWDGPVIIKTDANAHAGEEYHVHGNLDVIRFGKVLAARLLPWQWLRELPYRSYPILPDMESVPGWVWHDRRFVVERFLPEREGEHYVLRIWMFFGEQGYCMKVRGALPLVKSRELLDVKVLDSVPDEVRAARERHGLDFGKIDFVIHDGKPLVLDVNKTPTVYLNRRGKPGEYVRRLSTGLDDLMK
jgi:hypothetical protein